MSLGRRLALWQNRRLSTDNNKKILDAVKESVLLCSKIRVEGYCRGTAAGEKIFRGRNYGICNIDSGMKHDWRLIPKDQEQNWLDALKNCELKPPKVVESTGRLPPLMEKIFYDEKIAYDLPVDGRTLNYNVRIRNHKFNHAVLDKELENTATDNIIENDTR